MIELLVVKKMARIAFLSRLPTGHTHSDIDAVFAIIWKLFRTSPCVTLQEYKRLIEKALVESALGDVKMIDCMVVPDYKHLLESCIDSKLALLHKEELTQHQWRFESVEPSAYFPVGVKTTYRAYCSDQVVEFIKKPKMQCLSVIGQFTGLEPVTTIVRWYPAAEINPDQPVEGFYLLRSLPDCAEPFLKPQPFPEGCAGAISLTINAVHKYFDIVNDKSVREEWKAWSILWRPMSDSADDYVRRLQQRRQVYHQPLKAMLYDPTKEIITHHWDFVAPLAANINPDFQWPPILAAAMNSVQSEFNTNLARPRLLTYTDPELLQCIADFKIVTVPYYESILTISKPKLLIILLRRIYFRGDVPSSTGMHLLYYTCSVYMPKLMLFAMR
jgi:hypothetical protein